MIVEYEQSALFRASMRRVVAAADEYLSEGKEHQAWSVLGSFRDGNYGIVVCFYYGGNEDAARILGWELEWLPELDEYEGLV